MNKFLCIGIIFVLIGNGKEKYSTLKSKESVSNWIQKEKKEKEKCSENYS